MNLHFSLDDVDCGHAYHASTTGHVVDSSAIVSCKPTSYSEPCYPLRSCSRSWIVLWDLRRRVFLLQLFRSRSLWPDDNWSGPESIPLLWWCKFGFVVVGGLPLRSWKFSETWNQEFYSHSWWSSSRGHWREGNFRTWIDSSAADVGAKCINWPRSRRRPSFEVLFQILKIFCDLRWRVLFAFVVPVRGATGQTTNRSGPGSRIKKRYLHTASCQERKSQCVRELPKNCGCCVEIVRKQKRTHSGDGDHEHYYYCVSFSWYFAPGLACLEICPAQIHSTPSGRQQES